MMRENNVCCGTGGRFRIDFPGIWIVLEDDEGEHDEEEAMYIIY